MDLENPVIFAVWMLICSIFVFGAFLFLLRRTLPRMGRVLIDRMRRDGYSGEAVFRALQGALLPASVKRPLLHYAKTLYSNSQGRH